MNVFWKRFCGDGGLIWFEMFLKTKCEVYFVDFRFCVLFYFIISSNTAVKINISMQYIVKNTCTLVACFLAIGVHPAWVLTTLARLSPGLARHGIYVLTV